MILNKVENNGIIDVIYESSNVLASKYDTNNQKLTVTFKNGTQYSYLNVPKVTYLIFENADSQGKVLNSTIKQFDATKDGTVDTAIYLSEIGKIKDVERKNLELGLITRLKDITKRYDDYHEFDGPGIDIVLAMYEKYKTTTPVASVTPTTPLVDPITGQIDLKYNPSKANDNDYGF